MFISLLKAVLENLAIPPTGLTTTDHTSPGPPHLASSPAGSSETSHPGQLMKLRIISVCNKALLL
jgi:hypothetical protein